jgi:adenosylcobinamide-GDP ribazoletransferase
MVRARDESRAAVGFLTRIPIGRGVLDRPGAAAFGVIGAVMAAIAAVPLVALAGPAGEPTLGAIAAVSVLVVLSGAMHLDGLADTADALLARDPTSAERARKDPAVGPGGLAAVVLVVAAEVAALASIASADVLVAAWTMVVASGLARAVPVILVSAVRDGAEPEGLGSWFVRNVTATHATIAAITAGGLVAALALATTPLNARAALVGGVAGFAVGRIVAARRGGLDGDSFGASVELTFVAVLVAVAIAVS